MIRRSVEQQASQVLQTGTITLTDEKGNDIWELDLKPKPTHFPTVTIDWTDPNADPVADIMAVCDIVRTDGLVDVKNLVFDNKSWEAFLSHDRVIRDLKQDGTRLGGLNPRIAGKGAKYYGYVNIGSYIFDLWIYSATYNNFGEKTPQKYLKDNRVLFLPDFDDLDFRRIFGGIPIIRPDVTFDQLFGAAKVTIDGEYDFRPRVYWDEKAETFFAQIKSRPLCLPVSIDRFACLTTKTA
jgi:hypothetical protein